MDNKEHFCAILSCSTSSLDVAVAVKVATNLVWDKDRLKVRLHATICRADFARVVSFSTVGSLKLLHNNINSTI